MDDFQVYVPVLKSAGEWYDAIDWTTVFSTILAAALATAALVWQVGRQAQLAIEQSKKSEAQKLKLEIYESTSLACRTCVENLIKHTGIYQSLNFHLVGQSVVVEHGLNPRAPSQSYSEFLDTRSLAHDAAIELLFTIERWRIIEPRLDLFHTAINVGLEDWTTAASAALDETLGVLQPGAPRWTFPGDAKLENFQRCRDHLQEASGQLRNFVADFMVELQNLLLSDLFLHKVPYREPIDPKLYTVRLDRYDGLMKFFDEETTFGRQRKQYMDKAKAAAAAASKD